MSRAVRSGNPLTRMSPPRETSPRKSASSSMWAASNFSPRTGLLGGGGKSLVSLDELVSRSFVFGVKRGAWRSV